MTDLSTFARKLMRVNEQNTRTNTPRAIFGSIGDLPLAQGPTKAYRIGMWPCISQQEPEIAMGLFSILAHLLGRWQDVEVYRLFARLEGEPDDFEWDINASQFTVEEWDVEPLDENIGLWGELQPVEDSWALNIEVDNDLLTGVDDDPLKMSITAGTPAALVNQLPQLATKIADAIGAERLDTGDPVYPVDVEPAHDQQFKRLMTALFTWDVRLVAMLWGLEWDDEEIEASAEALIAAGQAVQLTFAAWSVSKALSHTMRPGYSLVGDLAAEFIDDVVNAFPDSVLPAPILAEGLFRLNSSQQAYNLLETEVQRHPQNTLAWLVLGQLLAGSRRVVEAVGRFQAAIELGATSGELYRAYGNLMQVADRYGEPIDTFVLTTPEGEGDDLILEAIAAYSRALELDENDIPALYARLLQRAELVGHEEAMWADFEHLIDLDMTGEYISDVIDQFFDLEDSTRGIAALEKRIEQQPERIDLHVNLAALHLIFEDSVAALPHIEKAETLVTGQAAKAEIERLKLRANDPMFEQRFAEIGAVLDAGNALNSDDAEYLESIVEHAPHLTEAHLALGKAYYAWDDTDAALEVLLDAQKVLPDIPAVIEWIARILWESGEKALAFQYLNQGMKANPFSVALLSQAGRYLFDNNQLDDARTVLTRAEEIEPRSAALSEVRAYIARRMAEDPGRYGDNA